MHCVQVFTGVSDLHVVIELFPGHVFTIRSVFGRLPMITHGSSDYIVVGLMDLEFLMQEFVDLLLRKIAIVVGIRRFKIHDILIAVSRSFSRGRLPGTGAGTGTGTGMVVFARAGVMVFARAGVVVLAGAGVVVLARAGVVVVVFARAGVVTGVGRTDPVATTFVVSRAAKAFAGSRVASVDARTWHVGCAHRV